MLNIISEFTEIENKWINAFVLLVVVFIIAALTAVVVNYDANTVSFNL
jgi:hypothetical protein